MKRSAHVVAQTGDTCKAKEKSKNCVLHMLCDILLSFPLSQSTNIFLHCSGMMHYFLHLANFFSAQANDRHTMLHRTPWKVFFMKNFKT